MEATWAHFRGERTTHHVRLDSIIVFEHGEDRGAGSMVHAKIILVGGVVIDLPEFPPEQVRKVLKLIGAEDQP